MKGQGRARFAQTVPVLEIKEGRAPRSESNNDVECVRREPQSYDYTVVRLDSEQPITVVCRSSHRACRYPEISAKQAPEASSPR